MYSYDPQEPDSSFPSRKTLPPHVEKKRDLIDEFMLKSEERLKIFSKLPTDLKEIALEVIALGQAEIIFSSGNKEKIISVLSQLKKVAVFYADLGGLFGYQRWAKMLLSGEDKREDFPKVKAPKLFDLSRYTPKVEKLVYEGVKAQEFLAEIVPLGGIAERLNQGSDKAIPSAIRKFRKRSFLEWIIRDLEGREYLHYKMFGKKIESPVVLMTSSDPKQKEMILSYLEEVKWFGREKIWLISQPLVPLFNQKAQWISDGKGGILMKPGGHGALWHLLKQEKIYSHLEQMGCTHAVIRQINNPIAGIDYGVLAHVGQGVLLNKKFGIITCAPDREGKEGIFVQKETKVLDKKKWIVSNIEYCKKTVYEIFHKKKKFPANTNILFCSLKAVEEAQRETPFPGLLINRKNMGDNVRLESAMQDIGEAICREGDDTNVTYLTYHIRRKALSAIKRVAHEKMYSFVDTEEMAQYHWMCNTYELLKKWCKVKLPPKPSYKKFLREGAPISFDYMPSLGPLFKVIGEKIEGGRWARGATLELYTPNVSFEDIHLQGKCRITSNGKFDEHGKCTIRNAKIKNLSLVLGKGSSFIAEDVEIESETTVVVPDNEVFYWKKKGDQ